MSLTLAEAVVNASPLIYLSATGHLDLLRLAGAEIVVPQAVAREVQSWGEGDPARRALAAVSWLKIVRDPPVPARRTSPTPA